MLYGMDIGGSKIELAVFDKQLNKQWTKRIETPHDSYDHFLSATSELVLAADRYFDSKGDLGIGIPGIVNEKTRTVYTTNIEVAKEKPFVHDLSQHLDRRVFANNDANCFALSEAYSDDFTGYENILGVILGTGLGGGIVVEKKIISGLNGLGGEIGHIKLPVTALDLLGKDIPLLPCGCGQTGCVERYLSGPGFTWLYGYFYQQTLSAPEIITQYYQHDPKALEHVDRYLELLALYLGNVLMVIDSDLIVFGGGLSNFNTIYEQLPLRLSRYLLDRMTMPRIEKARFGDSGGARGAALLVLNHRKKQIIN